MSNPWDWIANDSSRALLAGVLGGVVRWLSLREHWKDGIVSIVVGGICAVYISPLIVPWLAPAAGAPSIQMMSLAAFITGIGGIGVVGFVIDLWRAWRQKVGGPKP